MEKDIFKKRINYKPFEYPEVTQYTDAINKSFWTHTEVDFTADVQDFKTNLESHEQEAIKRALLTIAQIEVNVKTFWGELYHYLPKPEFNGLGATFAESEFRHSQAYSQLLDVLGYNHAFENLIEVPIIQKRLNHLSAHLKNAKSTDKKEYVFSLILFSLVVENVSLFSQFAIILSFTRFKAYMKNTSNIIAWTSVDEQLHAQAGIWIINKIREENPEIFTEEMKEELLHRIKASLQIEEEILEWILEAGDLHHVSKDDLIAFIRKRLNDSLVQIGMPPAYTGDISGAKNLFWFDEEIQTDTMDDFFAKRPVDYTKHDKAVTANDLF